MIQTLFSLMVGFAIADFALQTDAIAKGKNRHNVDRSRVPPGQKFCACWPYFLTAHALIHAGAVWAATGIWWIGLIEMVAHWVIDFIKCENWTNPHQDQALHFVCRIVYVWLWCVLT